MTAQPTERDRERAAKVLITPRPRTNINPYWRVDLVAQALADERERARAPMLALAEELERALSSLPADDGAALIYRAHAERIRAAAQDQP